MKTQTQTSQISIQVQSGNYILQSALFSKKGMRLDSLTHFTAKYGESAKSELAKEIKKQVYSQIYYNVRYTENNILIKSLGYFTIEEFQSMPKKWAEFKKFKSAYEKAKAKEAKEAYKIQQKNMPKMGNDIIEELDPRQLVYITDTCDAQDLIDQYPNREAYYTEMSGKPALIFKTKSNESNYSWENLSRIV